MDCSGTASGIGELPDAAEYGDTGSDTLGHLASYRKLKLPTLIRLGLANIRRFAALAPEMRPIGCYGRCALASPGKDTTTGHWEMAGIVLDRPLPLYPNGFPKAIDPRVREPDRQGYYWQRGSIGVRRSYPS